MRIVSPQAIIESDLTADALKMIEKAGRTCYKSENCITEDSAEKFAAMILHH